MKQPAEVRNDDPYTPLGDESPYSDIGNTTPTMATPTSGTKRAAMMELQTSKRRHGGDGSGKMDVELKEMLSAHMTEHAKTNNMDYVRADIAHCKELIRKLCPQLQGMEYIRILDMLGDATFRDVLRSIAEEGHEVFVHWLIHKLKE